MHLTEVLCKAARRLGPRCFKRHLKPASRYVEPLNFFKIQNLRERIAMEVQNVEYLKRPYLSAEEDIIADKYATTLFVPNDKEIETLQKIKFLEPVSYEERLVKLKGRDGWE
ncbi:unnamed protein product [Notodromas monacha]|uniref:Uncharacterized protein n=1 Tax=Notodromas monacha TaxID=399045 RepID=A0A7R9BI52_9CRUS|nr:unnamed protein product [Notodromas monacha]CAG0915936.1 unnamed protein product [Notodromas monacha]